MEVNWFCLRFKVPSDLYHQKMSGINFRYAFLHGFASGPTTRKGVHLKSFFKEQHGIELFVPDLNIPSFEQLETTSILNFLSEQLPEDSTTKWRLIASSLGGYIATRFAEMYPNRVDSLLLLAPAFDLCERWRNRMDVSEWKSKGFVEFYNFKLKAYKQVHYGFFHDLEVNHPPYPMPQKGINICIIHGLKDQSVLPESSHQFIKRMQETVQENVQLKLVDDGHELIEPITLQLMEETINDLWLSK